MVVLKCKMCGGDIQTIENQVYGTCDSCGSTTTLPRISDERIANLHNRANHYRQQKEFDKSLATYESILAEDTSDAEAHWGIVLSKFGIEYVEDPQTHKRVPTCHRVQTEPILLDLDYRAAIENSTDGYIQSLYEQEAEKIAEIQKGILAISNKAEPYDVFICYKETDVSGRRTVDSTLAQDIYYALNEIEYQYDGTEAINKVTLIIDAYIEAHKLLTKHSVLNPAIISVGHNLMKVAEKIRQFGKLADANWSDLYRMAVLLFPESNKEVTPILGKDEVSLILGYKKVQNNSNLIEKLGKRGGRKYPAKPLLFVGLFVFLPLFVIPLLLISFRIAHNNILVHVSMMVAALGSVYSFIFAGFMWYWNKGMQFFHNGKEYEKFFL